MIKGKPIMQLQFIAYCVFLQLHVHTYQTFRPPISRHLDIMGHEHGPFCPNFLVVTAQIFASKTTTHIIHNDKQEPVIKYVKRNCVK